MLLILLSLSATSDDMLKNTRVIRDQHLVQNSVVTHAISPPNKETQDHPNYHKVAVFFGSFDPLHYSHECIVQTLLNELHYTHVYLVAGYGVQETGKKLTSLKLRTKILQAFARHDERVSVFLDDINEDASDAFEQGIQKLSGLYKQIREKDGVVHIVVGSDTIERKRTMIEKSDVPYVVMLRDEQAVPDNIKNIDQIFKLKLNSCSSSEIRELCQSQGSIDHLVNPEVLNWIKENNLYRRSQ